MKNYNLQDFPVNGFVSLGSIIDKKLCAQITKSVFASRKFDETLFRSEEEFDSDSKRTGCNPRMGGHNLAEKYDLDFIEENPVFVDAMIQILGEEYDILLKKFVMGTPESIMPEWLLERTKNEMSNNLGPYIKPEFRDITYFHGIDWHQDIIDHPASVSDFITVYVYLADTNDNTSPLFVVPRSHILGASQFPHNIQKIGDDQIRYANDLGETDTFKFYKLLGESGSINFWHSSTLHGTQPHMDSVPRVSLRYLIKRKTTLLELTNREAHGFHSLRNTRNDIDSEGRPVKWGNKINTVENGQ